MPLYQYIRSLIPILIIEMGSMIPKEEWVDSVEGGPYICTKCTYSSNDSEFLQSHIEKYHEGDRSWILYMACTGSIKGRNILLESVDSSFIDCTGGQAACEDGDLKIFGDQLIKAARANDIKLYGIYRMHDPGLGLEFPQWWVDGGIEAGVFQEYKVPVDVNACAGG